MGCNHNSLYVTNLVSAARQNHKERDTIVQGDYMKVNVMCIPMHGEIGMEVHEEEDQLVTVVYGNATVKTGDTRRTADCMQRLNAGDSVFIPAGTWHNICNTGGTQLRLISTYAHAKEDTDCGCEHNTNTGRGEVFNASNYDWQNNMRTRDNGCSCAIDSGC